MLRGGAISNKKKGLRDAEALKSVRLVYYLLMIAALLALYSFSPNGCTVSP